MISCQLISFAVIVSSTLASYAPSLVPCPTGPLLRLGGNVATNNQSLNPDEVAYIKGRSAKVQSAFSKYLGNLSSTVYGGNLTSAPRIGISLSGGGDRAALVGAGFLSAMDSRNSSSTAIGGLLQSASYISALSGGSWLASSFVFNNFPMIYPMVLGDGNSTGWNLDRDVFTPGTNVTQHIYVEQILADLALKKSAGPEFNVTINDYWSRALSHHFLPGTTSTNFFDNSSSDHGASIKFSSATQLSSYLDHTLPFPIITVDSYSPSNLDRPLPFGLVPLSNVVYEFTPLEFGSYDPQLSAFIPMASLGTALKSGTPVGGKNDSSCASNFDNAGFVLGTSSCLFTVYNDTGSYIWTAPISPIFQAWSTVNSTFTDQPQQELDIAAYPNPFQGLNAGTFLDSNQTQLRLIDGGEAGENNPLASLIVEARGIEAIIIVDASADINNMPSGQALFASGARSLLFPNGTQNIPPLPRVPATFITQGLNIRPTFFGCKDTPHKLNGVAQNSSYPILVYIPNADPTFTTNSSTSQFIYPQASAFLDAASAVATRGIPTASGGADPLWPTCLACATVERLRGSNAIDITPACSACFTRRATFLSLTLSHLRLRPPRYCWSEIEGVLNAANGTTSNGGNSTTASSSSFGAGSSQGSGASKIGASIMTMIGLSFLSMLV